MAVAAPGVAAAVLEAAQTWEGEIPGRDRVRVVCAGNSRVSAPAMVSAAMMPWASATWASCSFAVTSPMA